MMVDLVDDVERMLDPTLPDPGIPLLVPVNVAFVLAPEDVPIVPVPVDVAIVTRAALVVTTVSVVYATAIVLEPSVLITEVTYAFVYVVWIVV